MNYHRQEIKLNPDHLYTPELVLQCRRYWPAETRWIAQHLNSNGYVVRECYGSKQQMREFINTVKGA